MQVKVLRGKIHRATVTGADVNYEGSITIDAALMKVAAILPYQEVEVWDVTNGERLQTYALPSAEGDGVVCVNGAAAHRIRVGDLVIIAAYGWTDEDAAVEQRPRIVLVNECNQRKAEPLSSTA